MESLDSDFQVNAITTPIPMLPIVDNNPIPFSQNLLYNPYSNIPDYTPSIKH